MRPKRKRVRLRPKPFIALALIGVIAAGIWWSPLTSIRKVRIEGAITSDQQRLEGIVKKLQDIPTAQIDPRKTESEVLELPEARSAELTRGIFGSALLKVEYREPVASLAGSPKVLLSTDGILYNAAVVPKGLPEVQLPSGEPPAVLALASNWPMQRMAELAEDTRKLAFSGVIRIQMDEGGVVCLNMDSGRVILGSLDDLDKKLSVLRGRLAANPDELSQVEALNLTAPDSPSFVPRKVK